jgi:hypothetical protein
MSTENTEVSNYEIAKFVTNVVVERFSFENSDQFRHHVSALYTFYKALISDTYVQNTKDPEESE